MSGRDLHEIAAVAGARQANQVARHPDQERTGVVVVGAGPCGLAAAIALRKAGIPTVILERGCLVSGIYGYPTFMTFFSTAERLSIGGIPFSVPTEKPTRRDALAYYRTVAAHFELDVRQYETVDRVDRVERVEPSPVSQPPDPDAGAPATWGPPPDEKFTPGVAGLTTTATFGASDSRTSPPARFLVHSRTRSGRARTTAAHAVVVATGYFGHPNRLGVPGEDLPHVTHLFEEGHVAYDLPVVVVGGGNSAVDAALDLYRAGARVTLVHFGPELDRNVKPWVMPDITSRIREGSIGAAFGSRVVAIEPEEVVLSTPDGERRVPASQVYLMLGYQPNSELLQQVGVAIDPATGIPAHDPATMETSVPGVYMAGVLASGHDANRTFIENGRHHGELIATDLVDRVDG